MLKFKNYSYSLLYVVTCAIATVLIENLVNNLSPIVALLYVTIIAITYFHVVNLNKIWAIYTLFFKNYKIEFMLINISIIFMWMCTYYGNYYSSPTIYNYVYFTTLGMVSKFKTFELLKNERLRVLVGVILIIVPFFIYNKEVSGALLAIIGGISTLFYNMRTYNLTTQTNITASQTIAVRFWGLFLVLLFIAGNKLGVEALTLSTIFKILLLAFLNFILQIWLSQKGLFSIGVKFHGIILSLTPLATLILQGVILNQWYWNLLLLTLICPFVLNDILWNKLKVLYK